MNYLESIKKEVEELKDMLELNKKAIKKRCRILEGATSSIIELSETTNLNALYQLPKILQSLLVNDGIGVIILDCDGKVLLFNGAAQKTFGNVLLLDELSSFDCPLRLQNETKPCKAEDLPWRKALNGIESKGERFFLPREGALSGAYLSIDAVPLMGDFKDQISGVVILVADITEFLHVENRVKVIVSALLQHIMTIESAQQELDLLVEKLGIQTTGTSATQVSSAEGNTDIDPRLLEMETIKSEARLVESVGSNGAHDYNPDTTLLKFTIPQQAVPTFVSDKPVSTDPLESSSKEEPTDVPVQMFPYEEAMELEIVEPLNPQFVNPDLLTEEGLEQLTPDLVPLSVEAEMTSKVAADSKQKVDEPAQELKVHLPSEQAFDSIAELPLVLESLPSTRTSPSERRTSYITIAETETGKGAGIDTEIELAEKMILVVDDLSVNQYLLQMQLEKDGFIIHTAMNGQEAVEKVAQHDYALVFMDCDMPVMNGFEATAIIRREEEQRGKHTPICAMTAYDRHGDRDRCYAIGMDYYLSKGAAPEDIDNVVRLCLKGDLKGPGSAAIMIHKPAGEAAQPSDPSAPLLAMDKLEETYGVASAQEIVTLFLNSTGSLIHLLEKAIEERDSHAINHFCFTLKGPCATMGIRNVVRLTVDIASYAALARWHEAKSAFGELQIAYERIKKEVKKSKKPKPGNGKSLTTGSFEQTRAQVYGVLDKFRNKVGDAGLQQIIAAYENDLNGVEDQIKSAILQKNAEALKSTSHKIAGCMRSLGAKEAEMLCKEMEQLAIRASWQQAAEKYVPMFSSVRAISETLKAYQSDKKLATKES